MNTPILLIKTMFPQQGIEVITSNIPGSKGYYEETMVFVRDKGVKTFKNHQEALNAVINGDFDK